MEISEMAALSADLIRASLSGADGVGMFADDVVERQILRAATPWHRLTIVLMAPEDFLALAAPIVPAGDTAEQNSADEGGRIEDIRRALGRLDNLPYLFMNAEGDDAARVVHHEGRHRATLAISMGVRQFPVQMRLGASGRPDGGAWPLMLRPPSVLLGEAGSGHSGNRVAAPDFPVTAASLGLEPEWAAAVGAAFEGINAALSSREPATAHPAGMDARTWGAAEGGFEALKWLDAGDLWGEAVAIGERALSAAPGVGRR